MRIAYMGTPPFAVPALEALIAAGHDVAAVYTQPPRPARRGKRLQRSAVHEASDTRGLEVRTPETFRAEAERAAFAALDLDVTVVAAYGLILPAAILDAPRHGCINIHASLLPRWRGAAPVQRAIIAGDASTGVTTMKMERGLDTGPMLLTRETAVDRKSGGALTEELGEIGAALIVETLARLEQIDPVPQPEGGVTYAHKIDKAEAEIDFTKPAALLEREIRAFNPMPGAFFTASGERIRILAAEVTDAAGSPGTVLAGGTEIACGDGALRPLLVQRPGKRPMTMRELLNGFALAEGTMLS